ncbi:Cyclic di-GMP phosphodiesterase Gmr [Paenibacillus konkukensis]|uniref:Cyclic di-GMP phosphodiesterase Gmr n=1 Tax=Paenibacillus konkukensis TaxID=2020716 RepID=A0ABY4RKF8_9BACL|nr:EAL domain-containing protein [Paenibacillus konkukensis]UQZ82490.1 Cyclic di-GMP phosphodiesterase Gmr [Paenibacillus konkukensis]
MVDYKHLVEDSIAGMFFIHNEALTFVNNAFTSLFGYASVEDFYANHRSLQDLMPLESYRTLFRQKKQVGSGKKQAQDRYMIECYHRGGHSIYVEVFAKMNRQDDEVTIYGTMIDVSDSIHMQRELHMSEQKYRSLFEYNTNLIYSFDLDGHFDSMNPAVTDTLGYSFDELIHMNFEKFIHPDDLTMTLQNFNEAKTYGRHCSYEARVIHRSGQIRHTHIINIPIYIDGQITGVYGIARDITELKNYIEQIERLAYYDYLTGLPNRRYFEQKNAEYYSERRTATLALIDLDGFKTINDTLGHDIGDELLKEFSHLLLRVCSSSDLFVSRIGGDEFAVIAPDDAGYPSILRVAEELLEQLLKPLHVNEFELYIAASVGICSSIGQETAPMQLFKHADIALYNAKAAGKRKISIYSHLNDEVTLKRFTLVRDIQQAIAGKQFYLEYQPRYDIKNQRVTCVEALLRWKHPSWGIVPPGEFIPIAEESGLIVELGKWALQTACREIKPLAEAWDFNLSVNVSVVQIMNQEFVATIKQILEAERFDPRRLELEITESALYNSEEKMRYFLDELKGLGIQVSLDDFGAGYSSLSFIQKYAIDTVKLDKTFVNTLTVNDRNAKIFSSIVSLLKSLETNVVAEGIETIEHYHFLTKNECDEAQGYLFSRPIPVHQLIEMVVELPHICRISSAYRPASEQ